MNIWSFLWKGSYTKFISALVKKLSETQCVQCDRRVNNCPDMSLTSKLELTKIMDVLEDYESTVVVFVDPNSIPQLSKIWGICTEPITDALVVTGLKYLGADFVLSTAKVQAEAFKDAWNINGDKVPFLYTRTVIPPVKWLKISSPILLLQAVRCKRS